MLKRSKWYIIGSVALGLLFLWGVGHLLVLRTRGGDMYPPYSSLRADPLGTMAFYQSLANLKGLTVSRHYQSLGRLQSSHDTTLFYLGTPAKTLFSSYRGQGDGWDHQLQRLTSNGARVVISLIPPRQKKALKFRPSEQKPKPGASKAKNGSLQADQTPMPPFGNLTLKSDATLKKADGARLAPGIRQADAPYPTQIPWHSTWYFDVGASPWRVLYQIRNRPVMIQQPMGDGMVILLTDAFLLSNEALRDARHPQFLVGLLGSNAQIVFDEAHLGINKRPGVAALARQNRLHWPLAGIIVLVLLYIWKNAMPLTPPPQSDEWTTPSATAGSFRLNRASQDYTQGLISLLDRHLGKSKILKTYVDQWLQTLPRNQTPCDAKIKRIQALFNPDGALVDGIDEAEAYHRIYIIISEK